MLYMIVAMCENRGIGKDNRIPWHLPEDLKHFKNLTMGHTVVMGRKTYESIGKPLGGRRNIVITSEPKRYLEQSNPNLQFVTFEECKEVLTSVRDAFIIGGSSIYSYFLDKIDVLYVTSIHKSFVCDTYFPKFEKFFELVEISDDHYNKKENCYFNYETYIRKNDDIIC